MGRRGDQVEYREGLAPGQAPDRSERVLVGGAPVHHWNRDLEETEVHRELAPVMVPVIEEEGAEQGSIATNVLTDRLARLEAEGIVVRVADPADRRRRRFHLTDKGLDLYPILLEIIRWSAKHDPKSPATPALV